MYLADLLILEIWLGNKYYIFGGLQMFQQGRWMSKDLEIWCSDFKKFQVAQFLWAVTQNWNIFPLHKLRKLI